MISSYYYFILFQNAFLYCLTTRCCTKCGTRVEFLHFFIIFIQTNSDIIMTAAAPTSAPQRNAMAGVAARRNRCPSEALPPPFITAVSDIILCASSSISS